MFSRSFGPGSSARSVNISRGTLLEGRQAVGFGEPVLPQFVQLLSVEMSIAYEVVGAQAVVGLEYHVLL